MEPKMPEQGILQLPFVMRRLPILFICFFYSQQIKIIQIYFFKFFLPPRQAAAVLAAKFPAHGSMAALFPTIKRLYFII